jgi:hypothetical protein
LPTLFLETPSAVDATPSSGETINTRTRSSKVSANLRLSSKSNLPSSPNVSAVSVVAMKPLRKGARKEEGVTLGDIEKIVARRSVNGRFEYLVKWPGFGVRANSWIPKENFQSSAIVAGFDQMMEEELVQNVTESVPEVMLEDSEPSEPTPLQEINEDVHGSSPTTEPAAPILPQETCEESVRASSETDKITTLPTDELDRAAHQPKRKKRSVGEIATLRIILSNLTLSPRQEGPGYENLLHSSCVSTPLASPATERCSAEASSSTVNGKKQKKIVRKQAFIPIFSSSQVDLSPIRRAPLRTNLTREKATENKGLSDSENQTERLASSDELTQTTMSFEKPASASDRQICLSSSIEGSPQSIPTVLSTSESISEPEEHLSKHDHNQTSHSFQDITLSFSKEDLSHALVSEISVDEEMPNPRLTTKTTITKMVSPIEEYERRRNSLGITGKSSPVPKRTSRVATKRKKSAKSHHPKRLCRSENSSRRRGSSQRSYSAEKLPDYVETGSRSEHPLGSDKEKSFVVEKILDKKIKNGEPLYYVKWKDYPHSANEWLRKENFDHFDMIKKFERNLSKGTKTKTNSSRKRSRTPKGNFELSISINDFEQQDVNDNTKGSSKITPNKKQNKRKSISELPQTQIAPTSASKLYYHKKARTIYSDKKIFDVEEILAKEHRDGTNMYFVKWEKFSSDHNSWIPEKNFCDHTLVEEFELKSEASTSKPSNLRHPIVQRAMKKKRSVSAKTQSTSLPIEHATGRKSHGGTSTDANGPDETHEVEKILDKVVEDGIAFYYVKWAGYDSSENRWVAEDKFNTFDLVRKYNRRLAKSTQAPRDPVEKILGKKKVKGVVQYLCKWAGYSYEHNSWTPHSFLDCEVLIAEFEERERKRMLARLEGKNSGASSDSTLRSKIPEPKEAVPQVITSQGFNGMTVFYNVMYDGESEPRVVSSEKANQEFPQLVMDYHKKLLSSLSPGDD